MMNHVFTCVKIKFISKYVNLKKLQNVTNIFLVCSKSYMLEIVKSQNLYDALMTMHHYLSTLLL